MAFPELLILLLNKVNTEHYQLLGNVAVKTLENALKIQKSSVKHYGGNPFATEVPLINMVSSDLITENEKMIF